MPSSPTHAPTPLARRRERWFYLLITPWLIGFVCLQGGPLIGALALALFEWRLPQPPRFVGVSQLAALLVDPLLGRVLWNTCYYAAGSVPSGIALGLLLALLLRRPRRGVTLFRAIYFLPVVTTGVAMALLWSWIFNPRFGPLNALLAVVGIPGPAWLQDESWAMPALMLMSVWHVGVNMLVYLAALQAVPPELHAAAALDGADLWQRFRHVTWPLLSPVTFYLLVVNLIGVFQFSTPAYVLTKGGPNNATMTLPLYLYLNAFTWANLGYAAALAWVLLLLVLLITLLQFRLARQWVFYRGG
ncbi:MAG: carbohydrate ABC transporter permease [Caldilineaceae bacterium]